MNNINVLIDGIDYSNYVVSPLKMGNLLDEQLDEVNLTLRYIDKEYFEPQTIVKVEIVNSPEATYSERMAADILDNSDYNFTNGKSNDGHLAQTYSSGKLIQTYTKYFMVASDNAVEVPVGSGRFEHEIYLIERTKFLEGFIGDSLTFTNPTSAIYGAPKSSFYAWYGTGVVKDDEHLSDPDAFKDESEVNISGTDYFKSPAQDKKITIPALEQLTGFSAVLISACNNRYKDIYRNANAVYDASGIGDAPSVYDGKILQQVIVKKINANSETEIYRNTLKFVSVDSSFRMNNTQVLNGKTIKDKTGYAEDDAELRFLEKYELINLSPGEYSVEYIFTCCHYDENTGAQGTPFWSLKATDIFVQVPERGNSIAPKKLTISDTIERIFDTLEPNRATNRFSFDETQKEKYDKILAPEFTFTKMNVREMLRTVGGFIHAEPRLKDDSDSNVVIFDEYGSNEKSHISEKAYIGYKLKSDINDWCTALDSSAENLVNQLDFAQGVSYEPVRRYSPSATYGEPDITLRTENVTARFSQDESSFVPTSLPIYKIQQVKVVRFNGVNYDIDITPYVYEAADYGLLKSEKGYYPNGKAYALYYTQGQKNIKGLFYKETDPVSKYFKAYSIVNIIRAAAGDHSIKIEGNELYVIGFVIKYTPIYSTRIRTIKQTISSGKQPRTISYNQGENVIETRYYGENLKGVVARLGNVEKTYTYHLVYLSDIPKVGTLFDDNYYISAVYTEVLNSVIKCTVGLSKGFNRLSQYVGISSNKRMWEVSEKQSQQRQSIYTEYMKVSMTDMAESDSGVCFVQTSPFSLYTENTITLTTITTKTKNKTVLASIVLPTVASAIGNSMIFACSLDDNYSAGQKQDDLNVVVDGNNQIVFYSQYVPYCDYFGKFYYMDIVFAPAIRDSSNWNGMHAPEFPSGMTYYPSVSIRDWKYRKDNREVPQITYELAAVSDDEEIIIGSALMQNNYLVNNEPLPLEIYGFNTRLNKLDSVIDFTNAIKIADTVNFIENGRRWAVVLPINDDMSAYKAFAIVTKPSDKIIEATDDDGNIINQTIKSGGMLYIGINKEYNRIKDNHTIYFSIRKTI